MCFRFYSTRFFCSTSSYFPRSNNMFTGSFSPEEAARNPVLSVGWRTRRIKESPFVVQFVRTKWHVEKRELPHAEHHYRTGDFTTCSTISFLALSQSNELRQPEQLELLHLREMRNPVLRWKPKALRIALRMGLAGVLNPWPLSLHFWSIREGGRLLLEYAFWGCALSNRLVGSFFYRNWKQKSLL